MAQPARKIPQAADTPPTDPDAVARAYRLQRAKRRARLERSRERRLAGLRFAFVLLVLLGVTIFLSLTIWKQIERLFGL